jgi:hypothetical protein
MMYREIIMNNVRIQTIERLRNNNKVTINKTGCLPFGNSIITIYHEKKEFGTIKRIERTFEHCFRLDDSRHCDYHKVIIEELL